MATSKSPEVAAGGTSIRVLASEATPMGCQMLKEALVRNRPDFEVVFCGSKANELLSAALNLNPDIAIISIPLEDGVEAGFNVLQEIATRGSRIRVIIVVDTPSPETVVKAFRCGAKGLFSRNSSMQALQKCIETVHNGQIWVGNAELEHILSALTRSPSINVLTVKGDRILTPREEEIVTLVASGLTNAEIAERLKISSHTVKNCLFRIFEKLGVSNRVELILYAFSEREGT